MNVFSTIDAQDGVSRMAQMTPEELVDTNPMVVDPQKFHLSSYWYNWILHTMPEAEMCVGNAASEALNLLWQYPQYAQKKHVVDALLYGAIRAAADFGV